MPVRVSTHPAEQYCGRCGQRHVEQVDPTLRDALHDVASMAAYIALALQRVYGTRRPRAVLRTVVLVAQFIVVMGAVASVTVLVMLGRGWRRRCPRAFGASLAGSARIQRDKAGFAQRMRDALPQIFFTFVPVFAGVVALVYRRRAHYPAHLYFALHVFALCFAAAALSRVVSLVPALDVAAGIALMAAYVAYVLLALPRVYGGGWRATVGRGVLVGALSLVAFTLLSFVGLAIVFPTF